MLKRNLLFKILLSVPIILLLISINFYATGIGYAFAQEKSDYVYLGGTPVGIEVKSQGLIVVGFNDIVLTDTSVNPARSAGVQEGDYIKRTNNALVNSPNEFSQIVNSNEIINLTILRNDVEFSIDIEPAFCPISGQKKVGLILKNSICGIGTLTYVKEDGSFCTLGHHIADANTNNFSYYQNGSIFNAKIIGTLKATNEEAGALKGTFDKNSRSVGTINRNNLLGVYGDEFNGFLPKNRQKIEVANRNEITPGKAFVYSTIYGDNPDTFEIEIIKTENQDTPSIKSMIIRVTDKRLIEKCGGIVQGMSGSPIIQNGKLVGAVTHVLLSDPTIGYGIYADWLI